MITTVGMYLNVNRLSPSKRQAVVKSQRLRSHHSRESAYRNRTEARLLAAATASAPLHAHRQWRFWTRLRHYRSHRWLPSHGWLWRRHCPEISTGHPSRHTHPVEAYEMITWAQWVRASDQLPDDHQEGETSSHSASNGMVNPDWEHIYLYEFPSHVWPERLLPLCYWGCAICTYIDASTEHIFQCTGGGQGYILRYVAASLEEWLERWLAGEALQFL